MVLAGGTADAPKLGDDQLDRLEFRSMLHKVCSELARMIVADGEGATKLVEIKVIGALNGDDATKVARTISESLLVKTAFHGEDPNWGRIISGVSI